MSQKFRNSSDDSLVQVSPQLGCQFQTSSESLWLRDLLPRWRTHMLASESGCWLEDWVPALWPSPCCCLSELTAWRLVSPISSDPREKKADVLKSCHLASKVILCHHFLVSYKGLPWSEWERTTLVLESHKVRVVQAILVIRYCGIFSPFVQIAPDS